MAHKLYIRSEAGVSRLPLNCRPGILAARHVYAGIARDITKHGYQSVERRAHTSKTDKLRLMSKALLQSARTPAQRILCKRDKTRYLSYMDWLAFFIFLAASGAAAATGSMFQPGQWYEGLNKPSWTPPKLAFPIVWTILYILIAVAAARVVHLPGAGYALAFWALQIALNTLWTPIFFGLRDMKAGMVVILMLWVAVLCTLISLIGGPTAGEIKSRSRGE